MSATSSGVWEQVLLNEELTPVVPATYRTGADPALFTRIDDHTFQLTFTQPNPLFDRILGSRPDFSMRPPQYLSQFHAGFADKNRLDTMTREAGFENWFQLFQDRANPHANPEMPTIYGWQIQNTLTEPLELVLNTSVNNPEQGEMAMRPLTSCRHLRGPGVLSTGGRKAYSNRGHYRSPDIR